MAHKPKLGGGEHHLVRLGDRGRFIVPAAIRRKLNLRKGERLVLSLDEAGRMSITTAEQRVAAISGITKRATARELVDDLLEERRREARRERERG